MDNSLHLIINQKYKVKKSFTDFDGLVHEVGESWIYLGTNFLPYESGLTVHVSIDNKPIVYRLQWIEEEQKAIIENFKDYVENI